MREYKCDRNVAQPGKAPSAHIRKESRMTRYGMVLGLKPEEEEKYKQSHAAVWPAVLEMIRKCNIRNYSIYLKDHTLFSYFEYTGSNFAADMARAMPYSRKRSSCASRSIASSVRLPPRSRRRRRIWLC